MNTKAKEFTKEYGDRLEEVFKKYRENEEVTVPFILVISTDGKVKTHVGTIATHNAMRQSLTQQQKKELKKILVALYE